jgi:2-polyprenyl-3-methyl-5-hydroxy-6-metoxy-1,4-benzoquinol methylase
VKARHHDCLLPIYSTTQHRETYIKNENSYTTNLNFFKKSGRIWVMDQKTLDYYRKNAPELLKQYHQVKEQGVSVYFDRAFAECKTVLDIGCGAGQDLLYLLDKGYDAYGLEPCEELIRVTIEKYPQLDGRILTGSLPSEVENLKNKKFDAVLCSAVLMHIPEEDLFDSVYTIRNLFVHIVKDQNFKGHSY